MKQMLSKSNTQKVLEVFFQHPTSKFHIREIARKLSMSAPTASRLIDSLVSEGLVNRNKTAVVDEVSAVQDNENFRRQKRIYNIYSLYTSGLVDYLLQKFGRRAAIVLFGSYSRGEDIERSDIDIAVITERKVTCDLSKFGIVLKREISLHDLDLKGSSKEFRNNLANGIVLEGYLSLL